MGQNVDNSGLLCDNGGSKKAIYYHPQYREGCPMKKRIPVFLLSVLLALVCLCAPHSASAVTSVSLADSISYEGGYTTISWDVQGDDIPYVVYILPINGSAEQQTLRVAETTEHSARAVELIPGKTYKVIVTDADRYILDSKIYIMPEPVTFEDGKLKNTSVKISMEPRKMPAGGDKKKDTKKLKALKASEIIAGIEDGSTDYGIRYTMKMPKLAKARTFFVTIAFESPDGFMLTEVASEMTYDRVNGGTETLWFYLTGERFFKYLYRNTGTVPAGDYRVDLFWDGMWVNTSTFKVK